MKRILLLLLLASPAFGQAYSQMAIQNTTGNWLKAAPGASVFLCTVVTVSSDCLNGLNKVPLYTDQTLTAGTSNPITADVNGNYTLFATPGLYLQCVQAVTSFCQVIQIGGNGGTIGNCGTSTSVAYYPLANASINCDQFFTDNGSGNPTARSLGLTGAGAGFAYMGQGAAPTFSAANSAYQFAPTSIPTSLGFKWLGALPTNTDCVEFSVSGSVWTLLDSGSPCGTGAGIPGQATLNNPLIPTVTPTGTTGAASYSYGIIGCEDAQCADHSAISPIGSTSTGNATLSSSNYNALTAYADTLYGYRGYVICRTAGGSTQGRITGAVAVQAGKKFNDTGLSADGANCSSVYATNTTITYPFCLGTSLPGYPSGPGAPCGVDGPPLTPAALDDEMTTTFGAPGDVNSPVWTRVNFGGSTAAAWSNGEITLTDPSASSTNWRILTITTPSTPWTFVLTAQGQMVNAANAGLCLYDGTKVYGLIYQASTTGLFVGKYSNVTTFSSTAFSFPSSSFGQNGWLYLKIQDTGSNLVFSYSGDGINYVLGFTEAVGTFITPTSIGPCLDAEGNTKSAVSFDYFRRTQ